MRRPSLAHRVAIERNYRAFSSALGTTCRSSVAISGFVLALAVSSNFAAAQCCNQPATVTLRRGLTPANSIRPWPASNLPSLGNSGFAVAVPGDNFQCASIAPGATTFLLLSFAPGSVPLSGFGCGSSQIGELLLDPASMFLWSTQTFGGPLAPAIHAVPIPNAPLLCGAVIHAQGMFLSGGTEIVVTDALALTLGSLAPYHPEVIYPAGTLVSDLATADLNRDGTLDLVAANWSSNDVSVFLGNGNGTFQSQSRWSVGQAPSRVFTEDLNADLAPDLVTLNVFSNNVSVRLGTGSGTFGNPASYLVGRQPLAGDLGDVNRDGRKDIITHSALDRSLTLLLGLAGGAFQSTGTTIQLPSAAWSANDLRLVDITRDNRLDVVIATASAILVLPGNGNGTFGNPITSSHAADVREMELLDLNGDAFLDAVLDGDNGGGVRRHVVMLGNGNGSFGSPTYLTTTFGGALTVADFDGDGNHDIFANGLTSTYNLRIWRGNGDGSFQTEMDISILRDLAAEMHAADLDGDGRGDLITAAGNEVSVFLRNGNSMRCGGFEPEVRFATGTGPASVAIADVDGDNVPDLITPNSVSSNVSILRGNGDGSFQAATTVSIGGRVPDFVAAADLNGDAVVDLVTANRHSSTISVLLGTGSGAFAAAVEYTVGLGAFSIGVADMNGDSRLDLVVPNRFNDNVSVLLGNGNGTFQAQLTFSTASTPQSVDIADLNGDGNLDVATANFGGSTSILLGNGNGTLQPATNIPTGSGCSSVAIADLNADGDADVVTSNFFANNVSVLLGNGNGTFQAQRTFAAGLRSRTVRIADLNGDGNLDLAVANEDSDDVSVLRGDGTGQFAAATSHAAGDAPVGLALSDLNGDSWPDIAVANYQTNDVSVLLAR